MFGMPEAWAQLGTTLGSIAFMWAIFDRFIPGQLRLYVQRYTLKFSSFMYPYIAITFHEYTANGFRRSEAYSAIRTYLSVNSINQAKSLKADDVKGSKSLLLGMDDHEEVTDTFNGVKVWWRSNKSVSKSQSISFFPAADERLSYRLSFHKRHRELITQTYLIHVIEEGKRLALQRRERKLYTNNPSQEWGGYKKTKWSHVTFEHPATFDTLAMEEKKKEEIKKDLIKFRNGKHYYAKIGKAWKRGYLLYGPPGTGKSTMIAAIANFMNYDVYDLELTAVKENTELRKLLIDTTNKSVIVIEDIDCSIDLTGQRNKNKDEKTEAKDDESTSVEKKVKKEIEGENKGSKVTLSGLLNFIDGLWSACGGERIIVFTTNFVDKLDPALIRRGRMDKHIEMSYCTFEAFKILAYNYLDVEYHHTYAQIEQLLKETEMTPADVAENLMPKSDDEEVEICFKKLIESLETAKEEARTKAKEKAEEERLKVEKKEEEANKKGEKEETKEKETISEVKSKKPETGVKENGVVTTTSGNKDD